MPGLRFASSQPTATTNNNILLVMQEVYYNPVKRGYVDCPEHWRYSSARNYAEQPGLIEIDSWF